MEVLHVKKYNELQTEKWRKDHDQAIRDGRWHTAPQLVFYVFNKNYGYVAFGNGKALWHKTKKGVTQWWKDEELKRKVRGW